MSSQEIQICSRCVIDTTDPEVTFDTNGECRYCKYYDDVTRHMWFPGEEGKRRWDAQIEELKRAGRGRDYDCMIGLSGGADSSYLAYLGKKAGLRMLAVHVDAGWNSELAVANIEKLCKGLNLDLVTEVVDWPSMQDLQRCFLQAGVVNQDIPQDHAYFAALYKYAVKNRIRFAINGFNISSENTLPVSWQGHPALDSVHVKSIHDRFSKRSLKKFPLTNYWTYRCFYPWVLRMRFVAPLNYMDYDKEKAKLILAEELDWKDYSGKHGESRFTRFHQNYFLPQKFGYDKRKAHLASLILSGQMTRDQAMEELSSPPASEEEVRQDVNFVRKKLNFSTEEFDRIMAEPPGSHDDYASSYRTYAKMVPTVKKFLKMLPGRRT